MKKHLNSVKLLLKGIVFIIFSVILIESIKAYSDIKVEFNSQKSSFSTYYSELITPTYYLLTANNLPFLCTSLSKLSCVDSPDFDHLAPVNKDEYEIIGGVKSYLSPSISYWSQTKNGSSESYLISKKGLESTLNSEKRGIRPTMYIKGTTKVTGEGTITNPWQFIELVDTTPVISLKVAGSASILQGDNNLILDTYFNYNQNGGFSITSKSCINTSSGNVVVANTNTLAIGTHTIRCTVSKDSGLSAYADKTIVVQPAVVPLYQKILSNNTVKVGSPNYTQVAADNANNDGLWSAADDYTASTGTPSYYFRGNAINNNVIFGGFQWKVIRITGKNEVRLIYNGVCSSPTCTINTTGTATQIAGYHYYAGVYSVSKTMFDGNTYVGYKYGTPKAATYAAEHSNATNSYAKTQIDNWYNANLSASSKALIADSIYCNDRTVTSGTGFGTKTSRYSAYTRLTASPAPSLLCPQVSDRFTISTATGNGKLTYPVAMITADEYAMGGVGYNIVKSGHYLYTNQEYFTMTPFYFNQVYASIFVAGIRLIEEPTSYEPGLSNVGLRPVITLKSGVKTSAGNGSKTSPYIIPDQTV